jgi:hypothetical protein
MRCGGSITRERATWGGAGWAGLEGAREDVHEVWTPLRVAFWWSGAAGRQGHGGMVVQGQGRALQAVRGREGWAARGREDLHEVWWAWGKAGGGARRAKAGGSARGVGGALSGQLVALFGARRAGRGKAGRPGMARRCGTPLLQSGETTVPRTGRWAGH